MPIRLSVAAHEAAPVAAEPRGRRRAVSGYRRFAGCSNRPVITGNPGCSSLALITSLIMWLWLLLLTLARCRLPTPLSAAGNDAGAVISRPALTRGMTPWPARTRSLPMRWATAPLWQWPLTALPTAAQAIRDSTHHAQDQAPQRETQVGGWRKTQRGQGERPASPRGRGRDREGRAGSAAGPAATSSINAPVETGLPGRASGLPSSFGNRSEWGLRLDYPWYRSYAADVRKRPEAKPVPAAG